MSILVWILQFMLAFAFLAAGGMKLTRAREQLAERMGRVEDFSDTMVKVIGGLEVLAGIGLIVPTLVNVAPVLAPWAAVGLVLLEWVYYRIGPQQLAAVRSVLDPA